MQKFQRRKSIVSIPHNMIIYCAAAEKKSFRYSGPDYMVQMMVFVHFEGTEFPEHTAYESHYWTKV